MDESTNPPAAEAITPAQDHGWHRTYEFPPTATPRVVWTCPRAAPGAFRVWANCNGVGMAGQFFAAPPWLPPLRALLALAGRVSKQLAAGVPLEQITYEEPIPCA